MDRPHPPWRYVRTTGCQWGLVCPGPRVCGNNHACAAAPGGVGENTLGQPMEKQQDWLANFDLSPMGLGCRNAAALLSTTHDHLHVRGSVRMLDGTWRSLAEYSGRYPAPMAAAYARCLIRGIQAQQETGGADGTDRKNRTATRLEQLASGGTPAVAEGPAGSARQKGPMHTDK